MHPKKSQGLERGHGFHFAHSMKRIGYQKTFILITLLLLFVETGESKFTISD